ncbi:hypothetical protein M407DRAFT_244353 [Tulasnella calospora MUT 4182]|uniref:U1-type domain-containing protein n=1 Tax=Tulasnella calospora MUT 4182 TaxID=1051891 RepID=A0A0C3LTG9_9AGAM|nr:hypothetical protein M407DRAFT_244353 [Tulasnella calospora MUT 4182]
MSSSETRYCDLCDKKIVVWLSTPNGDFNWKQHLKSGGHQAKVARSAQETKVDAKYSEQPPQSSHTEPLPMSAPPARPANSEASRPPVFKPFSQQASWASQEGSANLRPTADRMFSPSNVPLPPTSQPLASQQAVPPMSSETGSYLPTPPGHPPEYWRSPPNYR